MVDDEGTLSTVEVQAQFVNGKPEAIEAKYVMRSTFEWDRFMRFMERYADEHELGFTKVSPCILLLAGMGQCHDISLCIASTIWSWCWVLLCAFMV